MNLNGKKIITDDGIEYLVIETLEYNNHYYVYMVNKDNELDAMFGEINASEELTIDSIDPDTFKIILPMFMDKFKNS